MLSLQHLRLASRELYTSGAFDRVSVRPLQRIKQTRSASGLWQLTHLAPLLSFIGAARKVSRRRQVTMAKASVRPYGEWESPITASFITAGAIKLGAVSCGPDGILRWMEGRPQEAGRQVVCRFGKSEKVDLIPKEVNARTRVHEYGGVPYWISPEGALFYSNFADQRLYMIKSEGDEPVCLTPSSVYEEDRLYRFADCVFDLPRKRLICIREDHTNPKPSEVKNTICSVSWDGTGKMEVLVKGFDFYAAPKLSPDGKQLAYICWNHPSMPWDATELHVARLDESGLVSSEEAICGGDDPVSVLQPAWSPTGTLHFIADTSGWWNLYTWGKSGIKSVYEKDAEFAGAAPGWQLGQQNYCFLPDGRCLACFADRDRGASRLVDVSSGREYGQEEGLPRYFGGMCADGDGKLYFLGGDPARAPGIYAWALPENGKKDAEMLLSSMKSDMQVDEKYISKPELIEFRTGSRMQTAYAFYYPPSNADFSAPEGSVPPLLVKAHGGPTAQTSITFNPALQFWTSRGFAVLDVDYRGSTGYGRAYRMKLLKSWGVVDIEDVCEGAQHLVKKGLADPKRLAIDGGSAGGYTTLGALTFRDVFTAGCSLYGVADLATLAGDTHKFESRYLDGLVGPYPEEKAIYEERAPICHTERLSCPILLLQGDEDKIVPPNQAELMYDAVKARGLACALKIYKGEQHGFRRSENIEDALNSELAFYGRIFNFQPSAGEGIELPSLDIANLD
ncbi:Dipeptidyl aminopeptidase BIII (DAP BIII) [Durusdinium trenchii]|uniref:Dipeptidyl aminopeptidase BIII (DAP BIII) n=1 Tax=Durusdinium trenchii TaxID=1381693 RepID=A0ABP0S7U7_9DINO